MVCECEKQGTCERSDEENKTMLELLSTHTHTLNRIEKKKQKSQIYCNKAQLVYFQTSVSFYDNNHF